MHCEMINLNQTLSTLEIAEFCGKRHDNIIRDLKALEKQGLVYLLRFEELQTYTVGDKGGTKTRRIYHLPFEETMTLIAGYNAEIRHKIIKRWTALEKGETAPALANYEKVGHESQLLAAKAKVAKSMLSLAKAYGFKGNQALLSADLATQNTIGFSPLEALGHQQLPANSQEIALTPTELGQHMEGLSAQKVNEKLAAAGFQKKLNGKWHLTAKGTPYALVLDTGKKHNSGSPVQQIKWYASVLKSLQHE